MFGAGEAREVMDAGEARLRCLWRVGVMRVLAVLSSSLWRWLSLRFALRYALGLPQSWLLANVESKTAGSNVRVALCTEIYDGQLPRLLAIRRRYALNS